MNKNKFQFGDLIRFKHEPSMIGLVIKTMRNPFVWKYKIKWSSEEQFDMQGLGYGWKHDGWFNEHTIESAKEKRDD